MSFDNLIFLHIPKAAGSTLHSVLERHYNRRNYCTISIPEQLETFKKLPEEVRQHIKLLKGHMPFGMDRYLFGPTKYITLLRNPTERIVSYYYYVKYHPSHYLHRYLAEGMGLAEFAGAGLTGEMDNGQVRLLSGHDQDIPCGACSHSLLATAKRNLEQSFAVAGLTERFDESLMLMSIVLGWNWIPYYRNQNVSIEKRAGRQLDSTELSAIQQANTLDLELYSWVAERFQVQLDKHRVSVEEGLSSLNLANRLYQPFGWLADASKRRARSYFVARGNRSR